MKLLVDRFISDVFYAQNILIIILMICQHVICFPSFVKILSDKRWLVSAKLNVIIMM